MEEKKLVSKRSKKAKKVVFSLATAMIAATVMTITAFADVDASEFINKACTVLKTVIIIIGFGLGAWGVINLLEAYSSNDPSGRSQGIKQFIGGLGIILVGVILVPVLQSQIINSMGA